MKVFSAQQVREIDRYTIEHEPILSIDLMERAANAIFCWIVNSYSSANWFYIFAGPGNNGGDGVALARMLVEVGYNVKVFVFKTDIAFSSDLAVNIQRLQKQAIASIVNISSIDTIPIIPSNVIIVDALFGSGLSRLLEGVSKSIVDQINNSNAQVVSIDIPSGLFANENPVPNSSSVVKANFTLSLQFPKLSFFFTENSCFVGQWIVLPIGLHAKAIKETPTPYQFLNEEFVSNLVRKRLTFDHKGSYGHCLVVAGSYGMFGAATLSSKACLKAGAGLVTAHIPRIGYSIMQHSVPEVMVSVDENDWFLSSVSNVSKYSAIAIGPGLGTEERTEAALIAFLKNNTKPLVIDADALNIIASNKEYINYVSKGAIITPHPGEFDRLFGNSKSGYERLSMAIEMAQKFEIVIVLKGAFTQIVTPAGNVYFNCTGNPGMATGGSGDVLTGIIVSLLGQGYSNVNAAIIGVYLHGLAGNIAKKEMGEEAIIASDIIKSLGAAFSSIH
jgi:NAD(P)H-hydrate epimerase